MSLPKADGVSAQAQRPARITGNLVILKSKVAGALRCQAKQSAIKAQTLNHVARGCYL